MTPDEKAQMADALVLAQSRAMASVFMIEALLIELARANKNPRECLSRALEHSLYRSDQIPPGEERQVWKETRVSIEQLFSRVGEKVFRPRRDDSR